MYNKLKVLSNNAVLKILAKYQQQWEGITNKLLFNNSDIKAVDIVQDMYLKIFDDLTNDVLQIENLIINNKPHFGIVKNILYRIILEKAKKHKNHIRIQDLHKEIKEEQIEEQKDINKEIDEVLKEMYWFDRKLFNLYRKEFQSIRKLSKATKISHVTVHKTIAKCKQELKNKIKL